jgi:hypothetical protein
MAPDFEKIGVVRPDVIRRSCGGWLARHGGRKFALAPGKVVRPLFQFGIAPGAHGGKLFACLPTSRSPHRRRRRKLNS